MALTLPPCILESFEEFFLNLILYDIKFLKGFGLWSFRQIYPEKCSSQNKKCSSSRSAATPVRCSRILKEEYGKQSYIVESTIEDSRKWFKSRFGLQAFAGNFSHDRRFAKTDWLCRCKISIEDEGHIVSGQCPVYGGLRTQFGDLGEDRNLVAYFTAVLDMREELEEEDRTQQS